MRVSSWEDGIIQNAATCRSGDRAALVTWTLLSLSVLQGNTEPYSGLESGVGGGGEEHRH